MNKNNFNEEYFDEKEIDNIFDSRKNTKFKKIIKKAKFHTILRNIIISLLVVGIVLIGGTIVNRKLVQRMEIPIQIAVDSFNKISAPNKYIGKVSRYYDILGGRTAYSTYKIIEGKVVYTGEENYSYGFLRDYKGNWIGSSSPQILGRSYDAEDINIQRYNKLGQREMIFFYPFINYPEYKNDLNLLDEINSNKIMEAALSFDKSYSMDEFKKLLPKSITPAWYWIDDLSEQEKQNSKAHKSKQELADGTVKVHEISDRLRSEETVYGIKVYDCNGKKINNVEQQFFWALKNGMKFDTRFKSEFQRVYNNIAGDDDKLTREDIKVQGAVVTGNVENLKKLKDLSFVKASSIGVITEKY